MTTVEMWTDGGARGNPGPAAIGVQIKQGGQLLTELAEHIGVATNNQAEYRALVSGLEWLTAYCQPKPSAYRIEIYTDSELIAYQIQGRYKVKNGDLKAHWQQARTLLGGFGAYTITPIRREKNQVADRLVNNALDSYVQAA